MINKDLAKKQKLTEKECNEIESLQQVRFDIEAEMRLCDPTKDKDRLLDLFDKWRKNEFALQELWKFKKDVNYHRDYYLPYCTCPKLDNEDAYGTCYRIVNPSCVYHGRKK